MSYGVCWKAKSDGAFDYLAGIEVNPSTKLPPDFTSVSCRAGRYAVLTHVGHVSLLPQTIDRIWTQCVPDSSLKTADATCFERYTEKFDPKSGLSVVEIWIPLEA
jgi:AraC family transcriptional regulator